MAKAFVIDVGRCCGCYNCQLACKDEHVGQRLDALRQAPARHRAVLDEDPGERLRHRPQGEDALHPAAVQPLRQAPVHRRLQGRRHRQARRRAGAHRAGEVHRLQGLRDGLPVRRHLLQRRLNLAQKCTGCAHLLDNGYKLPRCVEACPTDAIEFGEEEDLQDSSRARPSSSPRPAIVRASTTATSPASSSPARCTTRSRRKSSSGALPADLGGKLVETITDAYGDFWFKDLAVGNYDVSYRGQRLRIQVLLRSRYQPRTSTWATSRSRGSEASWVSRNGRL